MFPSESSPVDADLGFTSTWWYLKLKSGCGHSGGVQSENEIEPRMELGAEGGHERSFTEDEQP